MTVERAVQLLQVSERARQGRLRARFMKEIREEERKYQRQVSNSTLDLNLSATLIQKVLSNLGRHTMLQNNCTYALLLSVKYGECF